jgi:hypothetical protein
VQFDLVSWLIGIPTKIGINWLSQWLSHKFSRKKQPEGDYFTATYSKGRMYFEGSFKVKTQISVEEIMQKFFESTKKEQKSRNLFP